MAKLMANEVTKSSSVSNVSAASTTASMFEQRSSQEERGAYEMSVKSRSAPDEPTQVDTTSENSTDVKKLARVQLAAFTSLSGVMFMQGWNDGTNGPLLPAIQRHYHVREQQDHTHLKSISAWD